MWTESIIGKLWDLCGREGSSRRKGSRHFQTWGKESRGGRTVRKEERRGPRGRWAPALRVGDTHCRRPRSQRRWLDVEPHKLLV